MLINIRFRRNVGACNRLAECMQQACAALAPPMQQACAGHEGGMRVHGDIGSLGVLTELNIFPLLSQFPVHLSCSLS